MRSQRERFTGRVFSGKALTDELAGLALGLAVIVAVIALFAFIMTRVDAGSAAMSAMSTAAMAVGCFCGGYVCARRRRRSGLLAGALCGVFIFLLIMIIGAFFSKAVENFSPTARFVTAVVAAAVGGVAGVNSKDDR